ncbi:MAG: Calx-beta domain-containing protein [Pyrinomonadaceae bacterium]
MTKMRFAFHHELAAVVITLVVLFALLAPGDLRFVFAPAAAATAQSFVPPATSGMPQEQEAEPASLTVMATQQLKFTADDGGADDEFGHAIAISGNTAVVGAPFHNVGTIRDAGAAYVFVRTGETWSLQQKLVAFDANSGNEFGTSVAISGDTVVVGAPKAGAPGAPFKGAAYVFVRQSGAWALQQKLTVDEGAHDRFGTAVGIDGDLIVVGAPDNDTRGGNAGAAYVFARSGGAWTLQQKLTASDGVSGDFLGREVAISGHTVVVGAEEKDVLNSAGTRLIGAGASYVFTRSGTPPAWAQQQILIAPDAGSVAHFGLALAVDGNTLVVGAPLADSLRLGASGAAYIFVRSADDAWRVQRQLAASDAAVGDNFGSAVSISGDTVVVGASKENATQQIGDSGAAYVFVRSAAVWREHEKLTASDGATSAQLGYAVGVSYGTTLCGAPRADIFAHRDQGAAYLYPVPMAPIPPTVQFSSLTFNVNESDRRATITVTRTGDLGAPTSVDYTTVDNPAAVRCDVRNGTAYARCDYATTVDTLLFAPGQAQQTFTIPFIDDGYDEGIETLSLRLSRPLGAVFPAQAMSMESVLTIADNDTNATANPIDQPPFFVQMQYLDFLSREPEPDGVAAWLRVLNNCSDMNNNPQCDRITVSGSFFRSQEFQLKGYFVYLFYKISLGRLPRYEEIIPDMRGVTGQTPEEVFAKRNAFAISFSGRAEFTNRYPLTLSAAAYVDALLHTAGVSLNGQVTRDTLIADLQAGRKMRAEVLRAIVEHPSVDAREYNGAFVAMQYFGYLRRDPETDGYNAWLRHLNATPSDFRTMVNGFMNSQEYRLRFGQP